MKNLICALGIAFVLPGMAFGQLADSEADFTTDGTQGALGWSNGYYNASADDNGDYDAADFIPFEGPNWVWNGSAWDWGDGNVPWTTIANNNGHPNGDNNGDVHVAIRRWESSHSGPVSINWTLAKQNVNCGNGVTGVLAINGVEVDSATVAFDDATGVLQTHMANLSVGDLVDLGLSPLGTDDTLADGCDGSLFGMTVEEVPEPNSMILLLVGAAILARCRRDS